MPSFLWIFVLKVPVHIYIHAKKKNTQKKTSDTLSVFADALAVQGARALAADMVLSWYSCNVFLTQHHRVFIAFISCVLNGQVGWPADSGSLGSVSI